MPINNYIHCGECWGILGEEQTQEPRKMVFDTADCAWPCDCERLNLSSDGIYDKVDSNGNIHYFFVRGDKERLFVEELPNGFDFERLNLPFTNPIWNP